MSHLGEERKSGRRRPHGYCSLLLLAVLSSLPVSGADMLKISRDVSVFKMNTQFHFSCVTWFFRKEQTSHFHLYLIFAGCSLDTSLLIRKSKWLIAVWSCNANTYSLITVVRNVHMNFGREAGSDKSNDSLTHHLSLYCIWFGLAIAGYLKGVSPVFLTSEVKSWLWSKSFLSEKGPEWLTELRKNSGFCHWGFTATDLTQPSYKTVPRASVCQQLLGVECGGHWTSPQAAQRGL